MFTRRSYLLIVIITLAGSLWLGGGNAGSTAHAAVQTTIGDGTPASCQSNTAINAFSAAVAAGGIVDFNCGPGSVTINVNTSLTDQEVTVNGAHKIVLSGEDLRQLFYVQDGGDLTLKDIILTDGSAGSGGAIYIEQQAAVTLNRSVINSSTVSGDGGAVFNRGDLAIRNSIIGSNIAGINGGGIFNNGGTVTVSDSYLISNQAQNGGAMYTVNGQVKLDRSAVRSSYISDLGGGIFAAGPVDISTSTFSNNRAHRGGALFLIADATILNATFNENKADQGGAIYREPSSTTTLKNSILAGSLDSDGDFPSLNCDGLPLNSLGRNIISDNSCVPNPSVVGDLLGQNPGLGIWLGSPVRGYIPQASSAAVDYGLDCPAVDQRGLPRPLGTACDVGSIEYGIQFFLPMLVR